MPKPWLQENTIKFSFSDYFQLTEKANIICKTQIYQSSFVPKHPEELAVAFQGEANTFCLTTSIAYCHKLHPHTRRQKSDKFVLVRKQKQFLQNCPQKSCEPRNSVTVQADTDAEALLC